MSKLLDILRKLGVFRSGSVSGTYTNAKDRPTELQMDGVFDAKKDLVNKGDVKNAKEVVSGGVPAGAKGAMALLIVAILLFVITLLMFFGAGFTWWTTVLAIVWLFLLFRFWQTYTLGGMSFAIMIVWLIFIFLISVFSIPQDSGNNGSGSTSNKKLTDAPFDKKVLKVSSADGSITGTIGLVKDKNNKGEDYLKAYYNLKFKASLEHNGKCGPAGSTMAANCVEGIKSYELVGRLVPLEKKAKKEGNGTVGALFCEKDTPAKDPFASGSVNSPGNCGIVNGAGLTTDSFQSTFQNNAYSYADLFKITGFEIYDASGAWESTGADTASINDDKAVNAGAPLKTYQMIIKE